MYFLGTVCILFIVLECKRQHCSGVLLKHSHFNQLMQVQLVTIAHQQRRWCGELWHIFNSVITREWYITVAAQQFLFQTPQVLRRTVYLCRSFDIFLCHISEEEILQALLLQSGADLSSQQFAHKAGCPFAIVTSCTCIS